MAVVTKSASLFGYAVIQFTRPMKILLLSYKFHPNVGGIESISEMLANHFVNQGNDVHVITSSPDDGSKVFHYEVIRNPNLLRLANEFLWTDVVFENNPSLRLSWPNLLLKRPSIIGLQTWLHDKRRPADFQSKLKRYWLNQATQIVACSNAIKSGIFPKAHVIGNPYDESVFTVKPQIARTKDFIFLGRLVSDKGVALAIDAFSIFLKNLADGAPVTSTLTIIGDGEERSTLEAKVKVLELEDKVIFLGKLKGDRLTDVLNQHRYLLVPSLWDEPFGLVALEGMACGCIPIVSDRGGLPDAVGKAGLVFKRGDLDSLISCMITLKTNAAVSEQLRREAKHHLIEHQSVNVANSYLAIMETL